MSFIEKNKIDIPGFTSLTLFTTALCNLNCNYCYICKDVNGNLKKIDDDIEEMFENNQFIKQILDVDPNIENTLESISLWGGEPFLGIYRFLDHIEEFFQIFKNLNFIDVSTNLCLPDHPQRIQDLVSAVEKCYLKYSKKDKPFSMSIQISIDGYEEMNDFGRGINTTKKICENWLKILDTLSFDDNNIKIKFFTKPTFSKNSWHFVDTPEKAYKWCHFFNENLWKPWNEKSPNYEYASSIWNNALPTEYIQNDGIEYSKVSQSFYDATEEVMSTLPSYRHVPSILAESFLAIEWLRNNKYNMQEFEKCMTCKNCGGSCGVFAFGIVPIPHNLFTMCHRGLFDAYTDYSNNFFQYDNFHDLAKNWSKIDTKSWVLNKEGILQMRKTMSKINEYRHQIWNTDCIQQIKYYAQAGLIDPKYEIQSNIIPTLGVFLLNSQCIQDGFMFGGTWTTHSPLEIPLYYNGTMDVVMKDIDRALKREGAKL